MDVLGSTVGATALTPVLSPDLSSDLSPDLSPDLGPDLAQRPVPVSLADTINHEFRNPLATLLGHLEMVREREDLPADVQFSLEAMHRAGEKISHLVTAAADIAEVTSAQL